MCPVGCEIDVTLQSHNGGRNVNDGAKAVSTGDARENPASDDSIILEIEGANCTRGREYVENELKNPMRCVTSSVRVNGGTLPITSVRLTSLIPRDKMAQVIAELHHVTLEAPVTIGQVVISDILGLGACVIVTKSVAMLHETS